MPRSLNSNHSQFSGSPVKVGKRDRARCRNAAGESSESIETHKPVGATDNSSREQIEGGAPQQEQEHGEEEEEGGHESIQQRMSNVIARYQYQEQQKSLDYIELHRSRISHHLALVHMLHDPLIKFLSSTPLPATSHAPPISFVLQSQHNGSPLQRFEAEDLFSSQYSTVGWVRREPRVFQNYENAERSEYPTVIESDVTRHKGG